MKQVFSSGKGEITVVEVPVGGRKRDSILVRNSRSIISSGTEGAEVSSREGVLGIYEQARSSREKVDKAWNLVKSQGVINAYEKVRDKLEDLKPMGYTCSGVVIETDNEATGFKAGDLVACMGAGMANHAQYVIIPKNLAARVPEKVSLDSASFAALGCIAMQGIRRLQLTPGERIGVIGLGLLGQLTVRLLVALGYEPYGMDLNLKRAEKADSVDGVKAWCSASVDSPLMVDEITEGAGLDGVIVTAATSSDQPVNLAFDLCRKRGRVSIVGDVGLGLSRKKMYRKELEARISCSYGPGRYDPDYEIRGHDYPLGYVRWTEKRNLECFLNLIARDRLNPAELISERFPIEQAKEAYKLIKTGADDLFAVLFDYGTDPEAAKTQGPPLRKIHYGKAFKTVRGRINIGVIGIGDHAKETHLPNLRRLKKLFTIRGLASGSGASAGAAAQRYGVDMATSDYRDLLNDPETHALIIATRHSSHAAMTMDALDAGKHVLVEKPLALSVEECLKIEDMASKKGLVVRVGYNRRFSPHIQAMIRAIGNTRARIFTARVNPGPIGEHWSNTREEGGRILGEGVHFFDLCNHFMNARPVGVSAAYLGEVSMVNANMTLIARYGDGAIGQVIYTTVGSGQMGKERFEAHGSGKSVISDDYDEFKAYGSSVAIGRGNRGDKGHRAELEEFAAMIRGEPYPVKGADPIAAADSVWMALASLESANSGSEIRFNQ